MLLCSHLVASSLNMHTQHGACKVSGLFFFQIAQASYSAAYALISIVINLLMVKWHKSARPALNTAEHAALSMMKLHDPTSI